MKTTLYQKGFTTTIYLALIIFGVIGIGAYVVYHERQQLLKKLEEKEAVIAQQITTIETLEQTNSQLVEANEAMARQRAMMEKVAADNDVERGKREKELRSLDAKYKALLNSLPAVLPNDSVATMTAQEVTNSALRIEYLWNVYRTSSDLLQPPLTLKPATSIIQRTP